MTNGSNMGTLYRFVPGVRRGFRPTKEFEKDTVKATGQPTTGVDVTAEGTPRTGGGVDQESGSVSLNLYGPGDVTGLDQEQVVRVEPEPETRDFPPNYFPFVEFDRPDLPWMFSPERADNAGRTRPWLTLVTVAESDAVSVEPPGNRPLPVLSFGDGASLKDQLPPLEESWAWAHAQIHGAPRDAIQQYGPQQAQEKWMEWAPGELQALSNITVSRLLSPRNLQPQTDYVACVVPTFKPGRRAGLGKAPFEDEQAASNPVELAWDRGNTSPPLELPIYYYWRFTAGKAGTFEKLVSKLEPAELGEGVGLKTVDMTDPGPETLEPRADEEPTVDVPGAMFSDPARKEVTEVTNGDREPITYPKADRLQELLNKPETFGDQLLYGSGTSGFPVVGPPRYCQWHAGLEGIPDPSSGYDPAWFRQLNRNVRNRVAASVGAEVVRENQDQLMSAAWEVVGEIREANSLTRYHQVAALAGTTLEEQFTDAGRLGGIGEEEEEANPWDDYWRHRRELNRIGKLGGRTLEDDLGVGKGWRPAGVDEQTVTGEVAGGAVDETIQASDGLEMYMGDTVSAGDETRTDGTLPDGGTKTAGDGPTKGAIYTQYLSDFVNRPETSLQFQRMVRRDGQLASRARIAAGDYEAMLEQASQETLLEVESLADVTLGRDRGPLNRQKPGSTPEFDVDGTDLGGEMSGDFDGGDLDDDPDFRPDGAPTFESAGPALPGGAGPMMSPQTAPTVAGPLASDPGRVVPRIPAMEAAEETQSALDARVGEATVEPDPPAETVATATSKAPPLIAGLVDGIEDHLDDIRSTLATDGPAPVPGIEHVRQIATIIGDSIDPLERAIAKAFADDRIAIPDETTRDDADAAMGDLETAHQDLVTALDGHLAAARSESTEESGSAASSESESPAPGKVRAAVDGLAAATTRIRRLVGPSRPSQTLLRKRSAPQTIADAPPDPRLETDATVDDELIAKQLARPDGHARYFRTRLNVMVTIPGLKRFAKPDDPVERVMLAPEFPTPMWRPLQDVNEDFLLPGASNVPPHSVGLVLQNREFIESYMAGLSHEMARELLWRGYPTDMRGTYFQRFWNKGRGPAWELGHGVDTDGKAWDIEEIHTWDNNSLRENAPGPDELGKVVLLVRSRLFERYPNTVVYAAKATKQGEKVSPKVPENFAGNVQNQSGLKFPVFRGQINPDITFLGFDLTVDEVRATQDEVTNEGELGWYFVFEERPGETRFGFDEGAPEDATQRPVGVTTDDSKSDPIPGWTSNASDGAVSDLTGWNGLSWHHIAGKGTKPSSIAYVSVADAQPGKQGWKITSSTVQKSQNQFDQGSGKFPDTLEAPFDEHDVATWKKNSAHMARISWQRPVRVSMHANELLPEKGPGGT